MCDPSYASATAYLELCSSPANVDIPPFLHSDGFCLIAYHIIVVQEVARSSRVSHPTSNPYSRLGSRGFTIYAESV